MNLITGKHMPRRTFLRGVGATVALPFLDSMVSAGGGRAHAAAAERTRLICIEEVHGLAGCNNWGASKHLFAPETSASEAKMDASRWIAASSSSRIPLLFHDSHGQESGGCLSEHARCSSGIVLPPQREIVHPGCQ